MGDAGHHGPGGRLAQGAPGGAPGTTALGARGSGSTWGGAGHHSPGGPRLREHLGGRRAPQPWGPPGRRCCLMEAPCGAVPPPGEHRALHRGDFAQGRGLGGLCPAELLTPRPSLPGASSSSSRSPSGPHGPPSLPALPTPLSDHRPLQPRQAPIPASARHPSCGGCPPSTP